jgi:hypothetical protein
MQDENMKFDANRRGAFLKFGAGLIVSGLAHSDPVNAAAASRNR